MKGIGRKKAEASSSTVDDRAPSASDHPHKVVVIKESTQVKPPSGQVYKNEEDEKKKGKEISVCGRNEGDSGGKTEDICMEAKDDVREEVEADRMVIVDHEVFFEVEAIRRKRNYQGQLQYLIKWRYYRETGNTWEPYDNIKHCTDMLEAFEKKLQKCKSKKAVSKKHLKQIEDTGDGIMPKKKKEDKYSPLHPVSGKERERSRGSVPALTLERDTNVLRQNPKRDVISRYMREKKISNDEKGKEICLETEASTNESTAPLPKVHQRVLKKDKKGGANFIMQDYVQKWREREEAKRGIGAAAMAIFLPNCEVDFAEQGKVPPTLLPMGAIPFESEPQGSKEVSRLTGAQKRKSGRVRRFLHPHEIGKKAADAELVDLAENLTASDHVAADADTGSDNKVKDEAHITKILEPMRVLASSSATPGNILPVCIIFKALRSDGTEVLVNNRELRATNPLLLLDFYEQNLHYTGP